MNLDRQEEKLSRQEGSLIRQEIDLGRQEVNLSRQEMNLGRQKENLSRQEENLSGQKGEFGVKRWISTGIVDFEAKNVLLRWILGEVLFLEIFFLHYIFGLLNN